MTKTIKNIDHMIGNSVKINLNTSNSIHQNYSMYDIAYGRILNNKGAYLKIQHEWGTVNFHKSKSLEVMMYATKYTFKADGVLKTQTALDFTTVLNSVPKGTFIKLIKAETVDELVSTGQYK